MKNDIRKALEERTAERDKLKKNIKKAEESLKKAKDKKEAAIDSGKLSELLKADEEEHKALLSVELYNKQLEKYSPILTSEEAAELWKAESKSLSEQIRKLFIDYKKHREELGKEFDALMKQIDIYFYRRMECGRYAGIDKADRAEYYALDANLIIADDIPAYADMAPDIGYFKTIKVIPADTANRYGGMLISRIS